MRLDNETFNAQVTSDRRSLFSRPGCAGSEDPDPHGQGDPGPSQLLDEVEILAVGPASTAVGGIKREPGEPLGRELPVDRKRILPPLLVLRSQFGQ
jgi:hypothetical protein